MSFFAQIPNGQTRKQITIGTRDHPGVKRTRVPPCECLLYAFACAEVSCATVREATLLGETMTINVLPDHVMRTVFVSLAAAIIVSGGMLLLTALHP